jgi:hypothetical protein
MRVSVDETGKDEAATKIDRADGRSALRGTDARDASSANDDNHARTRRGAGAVDDGGVPEHEILAAGRPGQKEG